MGAGVRQSHRDDGLAEHGLHRVHARVQEGVVADRAAVGLQAQVDERLHGGHAATAGVGAQRVVGVHVVADVAGQQHVEPVQVEGHVGRVHFVDQARALLRVGQTGKPVA